MKSKLMSAAASLLLCSLFMTAATDAQSENSTQKERVINAGFINARAMSLPKPEFPPDALAKGIYGTVNVRVIIGTDGNVETAEVLDGINDDSLRKAAVSAALLARFSPSTLEGKPARVSGVITYNFTKPIDQPENDIYLDTSERQTMLVLVPFVLTSFSMMAEDDEAYTDVIGNGNSSPLIKLFPKSEETLRKLELSVNSSPEERRQCIAKSLADIKRNLTPDELVYWELGEKVEDVVKWFVSLDVLMKQGILLSGKADFKKLRTSLEEVKTAVNNFKPELNESLRKVLLKLSDLADKNDFESKETMLEIHEILVEATEL